MVRVIVVSNRLPVTLYPDRQPPDDLVQSSGGLASALRSCVEGYEEVYWIGWPGCAPPADQQKFEKRILEASGKVKMKPVWLSQGDVDDFYTGFSNSSMWPLLHWMTPYARFKRAWAEAYKRVNEQFADAILSVATSKDLIWIHDYHLFLVPQILRRKRDNMLVQEEAAKSGLLQRPGHLPPLPDSHVSLVKRPEGLPCTPEDEEEVEEAEGEFVRGHSELFQEAQTTPRSPREEREAFGTCQEVEADKAEGDAKGTGYASGDIRQIRRSITQVELNSKLRIAFFLHTPFPSYEVLCVLPQCVEIVEGVLGADLIGFHTYNYLRHFRSCVIRLCGFTPEMDHVDHRGQRTKLGVFPIGANVQSITDAMKTVEFAQYLKEYTEQFQGKSLVLNVERLDYSKGLPQKLAAIQRYLEDAQKSADKTADDGNDARSERKQKLQKKYERLGAHKANRGLATSNVARIGRNWLRSMMGGNETTLDHNKTVFVFIAVPSRRDVEEYQKIEEEVHRSISTINGMFSTLTHQPIVYIHRGVALPELAALYARADCCLVTPLVDGMNLVAKEFIVTKDRHIENVVPGFVVLSELAGAAQELFDAMVVNPYDEDAVADAIAIGLELTRGNEAWEVTEGMRKDVMQNDAVLWGMNMLKELEKPYIGQRIARPERVAMQLLEDQQAQRFFESHEGVKAIFLDYDGTLREFEAKPEDAVPTPDTVELMQQLCRRSDLKIYIVSGRDRHFLETHFGEYESITLIAEHGYFKRGPDTAYEWLPFTPYQALDWKEKVRPVLDMFTRCTPGATIEDKASAVVWHYRDCDEAYGKFKAKELMHQLALSLGNLPCQISQGNKIVEVASLAVRKGVVVGNALQQQSSVAKPFVDILICGDDRTDESMFLEAPKDALTVKVGPGDTAARFRLEAPEHVRRFLSLIVDQSLEQNMKPQVARFLEGVERVEDREGGKNISRFYSFKETRASIAESSPDDEDPLAALGETEQ